MSGGGCALSVTLYVSDGTTAGTFPLDKADVSTDIGDGRVADALGNKLYFVAWGGSDGQELWVSDGTDSGTHRMAGSPSAEEISFLPAHGQNLYFTADGRLWKTDGTKAGTEPLTSAGEFASMPTQAVLMGKRLYFDGGALWKTNGTPAGTNPISSGDLYSLTTAGDRLFFTRGGHLWTSDGTPSGTKDMGVFGAKPPRAIAAAGKSVCFAEADFDNAVWTLWKSDGSAAGTYQVASFVILGGGFSTGDGPIGTAVGPRLFFSAGDVAHGSELWSYVP
jgi:hypothetical protein